MADSGPWLRQANSDLLAANKLRENAEPQLLCQVAAKCQQTIEKSIKAIATELDRQGIVSFTIGFSHEVSQFVEAIRRAPRGASGRTVPDFVQETLERNRLAIAEVMALAPRRGPDQAVLLRNAEYPFHDPRGNLVAPADAESFKVAEVDRFLAVAGRVAKQANALVRVARRAPQ